MRGALVAPPGTGTLTGGAEVAGAIAGRCSGFGSGVRGALVAVDGVDRVDGAGVAVGGAGDVGGVVVGVVAGMVVGVGVGVGLAATGAEAVVVRVGGLRWKLFTKVRVPCNRV
jgi:hypothetical protein